MEHIFVMTLNVYYFVSPTIWSLFKNSVVVSFFLLELDMKAKKKRRKESEDILNGPEMS